MVFPVKNLIFLIVFAFLNLGLAQANEFKNASFESLMFDCTRWPRQKHPGWMSFGLLYGQTDQCYDEFGNYAPLFAGHGAAGFGQMAGHYKHLTQFPATKSFIENTVLHADFLNNFAEKNSLVCGGKLELIDLNMLFSLPISQDFTLSVELPIRSVRLSNLKFVAPTGTETDFAKLVNQSIGPVLKEHGFEPLSKTITVAGPGDAVVSLGWTDRLISEEKKAIVSAVGLSLKCGAILPTAEIVQNNKNFLYMIPAGNNGNFGIKLQGDAEINFRKNASIIGMFESKVFLKRQHKIRLTPDTKIQNSFFGQSTLVTLDNGHAWKAGAALKVGSREWGGYLVAGYSYSSKEITRLELSEQEVANPRIFDLYNDPASLTVANLNTASSTKVSLTNEVLNSGRQMARQYAHTVHLSCQITSGTRGQTDEEIAEQDEKCSRPIVEFGINWPLLAKNYLFMPQFTGTASFSVKIEF